MPVEITKVATMARMPRLPQPTILRIRVIAARFADLT